VISIHHRPTGVIVNIYVGASHTPKLHLCGESCVFEASSVSLRIKLSSRIRPCISNSWIMYILDL
jgi:hypothetical protein